MAEIRFKCPECKQRMAVEAAAAGQQMDCPTCRSTLIVPETNEGLPTVAVKRRMTVFGGTQAELYAEIERTRGLVMKEHEHTLVARAEADALRKELEKAKADADKRAKEAAAITPADPGVAAELEKTKEMLAAALRDRDTVATRLAAAEQAREAAHAAQVEMARLRQERSIFATERDTAKDHAKKAEGALYKLQERMVDGEKERSELKAHIALLQVQFEEAIGFRKERDTLQQRVAGLEEKLNTATAERDKIRINAAQAAAELKAAKAKVAASKMEPARQRALEAGEQAQEKISGLETELASLREKLSEAERQREQLEQKLQDATKERETISSESSTAAAKREELAGELAKRDAALAEASKKSESELAALREKLSALEAQKADREKQLETARQERERIAAESTAVVAKRDELAAELAKRDAAIEGASKASEAQLGELREKLSNVEREKGELERQLQETRKERESVAGESAGLASKRDELAEQLSRKESELADRNKELETLRSEIEALRNSLEDAGKQRDQALADLRAAEQKAKELEGQMAPLETKSGEHEQRLNELKADLERVSKERDEARISLADRVRAYADATATAHAAVTEKNRLTQVNQKIAEEHEKLRKESVAGREKLANLEKESQRLHQMVQEAQKALEKSWSDHENTRRLLAAADAASRDAAARLAQAGHFDRTQKALLEQNAQKLAAEQQKTADIVREREELRQKVQTVNAEIQKLRADLASSEEARKTAVERIASLDRELADLNGRLGTLTGERDRARAEMTKLNKEIDELERQKAEAETVIQTERQKLQPMIESRDQLAQQVQMANGEIDQLKKDLASARSEGAAASEKAREFDGKLAAAEAHAKTLTEERDNLKAELLATNAGLERAKQHVAVLQSRRDQLRDEISHLKDALGMGSDTAA